MKKKFILLVLMAISINSSGQGRKLEKLIAEYAYQHQFSGTVLVQKNRKILNSSAYGMANIPFDVPNQVDTKFQIASITKLFTAVLILQLYEQGKLDLNGSINRYLPEYSGEAAQKVNIHQLLNHTSGMENMENNPDPEFKSDWLGIYGKPYTSDQILSKFCSGKMIREPGSKFDYNNGEYIILGKIIERIYGKSYATVLKEQLLIPLRMSASGMCMQAMIRPAIADTYSINFNTKILEKDEPTFIQNWYAAGAMYSTTKDLMSFVDNLFSYKLLKKETVNLLTKPGLNDYGYGAWIRGKEHKVMERYGRIRGTNTVILRYLDSDLTVVILSNTDCINNLGPFAYHIAASIK